VVYLLVEDIIKDIKSYADQNIASHSQKFFKTGKGEYGEGDRFLGIRVPILRKLSKKYRDIPTKIAIKLLKNEYHEIRLLALFILTIRYQKAKTKEEQKEIYDLYLQHTIYINNWDLADSSANKIVGAYLVDKDREILYRLATSNSLWERRVSIISTFAFVKIGQYQDTLKLANMLLTDKEDLIHKAVGWALREVGKKDKKTLVDFLDIYYKTMPRVMLRYSLEKFTKEERVKYMG
jgi:3-methyladenine DNA glycosylase AlkD